MKSFSPKLKPLPTEGPDHDRSSKKIFHSAEPLPLVSVIIPCYNSEKTITRTIDSVLAQSYTAVEIIAVDDVSRDRTGKILRDLDSKGLLRHISMPENSGPAGARNAGLQVARGEFVAFIDADDEWEPDKLRRQVAILAANPKISMVGCRLVVRNLDGTTTIVNEHRDPPVGPEAWKALLQYSYYVPTMMMTRLSLLREIGSFDTTLRGGEEDQDIAIRLGLKGEIAFIPCTLGTMHQQPASLSTRFGKREWTTVIPLIERHCQALREQLTDSEIREILGSRYTHVGRQTLPVEPVRSLRLILHAVFLGYRPVHNIIFIATVPLRLLKQYSGIRKALL